MISFIVDKGNPTREKDPGLCNRILKSVWYLHRNTMSLVIQYFCQSSGKGRLISKGHFGISSILPKNELKISAPVGSVKN